MATTSAQFSLIRRVELERRPGTLGGLTSGIGRAGGQIGAVDILEQGERHTLRQLNVDCAVLALPGVFHGALDARATAITEETKLAAAEGIASVVADAELSDDYVIPSVFDRRVSRAVAEAVTREAEREGVVHTWPASPSGVGGPGIEDAPAGGQEAPIGAELTSAA